MPGPWRPDESLLTLEEVAHFNLRRDARPLATGYNHPGQPAEYAFQSQTRCQAPGDAGILLVVSAIECHFNLRRDARPLATAVRLVWPVKRIHDVVREGATLLPLFRGLCCSMR